MIELPGPLEYLAPLVGMEWPKGNEDEMWALAGDWQTAAAALRELVPDIEAAKGASHDAYPSGEGAEDLMKAFDSMLVPGSGKDGDQTIVHLASLFEEVGSSAHGVGTEIEYMKLMYWSSLAMLAGELAAAWIFPPTAPAVEAAAIAATRIAVRIIGERVVAAIIRQVGKLVASRIVKFLLRHVLLNTVLATVQDWGIQEYQVTRGHRDKVDMDQVLRTALAAAAGGAAAAPVGHFMGKWLNAEERGWARNLTHVVSGEVNAFTGLVVANGGIPEHFDWRMFTAAGATPVISGKNRESAQKFYNGRTSEYFNRESFPTRLNDIFTDNVVPERRSAPDGVTRPAGDGSVHRGGPDVGANGRTADGDIRVGSRPEGGGQVGTVGRAGDVGGGGNGRGGEISGGRSGDAGTNHRAGEVNSSPQDNRQAGRDSGGGRSGGDRSPEPAGQGNARAGAGDGGDRGSVGPQARSTGEAVPQRSEGEHGVVESSQAHSDAVRPDVDAVGSVQAKIDAEQHISSSERGTVDSVEPRQDGPGPVRSESETVPGGKSAAEQPHADGSAPVVHPGSTEPTTSHSTNETTTRPTESSANRPGPSDIRPRTSPLSDAPRGEPRPTTDSRVAEPRASAPDSRVRDGSSPMSRAAEEQLRAPSAKPESRVPGEAPAARRPGESGGERVRAGESDGANNRPRAGDSAADRARVGDGPSDRVRAGDAANRGRVGDVSNDRGRAREREHLVDGRPEEAGRRLVGDSEKFSGTSERDHHGPSEPAGDVPMFLLGHEIRPGDDARPTARIGSRDESTPEHIDIEEEMPTPRADAMRANRPENMPESLWERLCEGVALDERRAHYYRERGGGSEINLGNGKRLDSYVPDQEIVSRKNTQLLAVEPETAAGYLAELAGKYHPGETIKDTPHNRQELPELDLADPLRGDLILEVPPQLNEPPRAVLERAAELGITIRDTEGRIYELGEPHPVDDAIPDSAHRGKCADLALRLIKQLTGSEWIRPIEREVGLDGMTVREVEAAAQGQLRGFDGHDDIARQLLDMGHGSSALVVDEYAGAADRHGVGAHAYVLVNDHGVLRVRDPGAGLDHGYPPSVPRESAGTHGILFDPRGKPVDSVDSGAHPSLDSRVGEQPPARPGEVRQHIIEVDGQRLRVELVADDKGGWHIREAEPVAAQRESSAVEPKTAQLPEKQSALQKTWRRLTGGYEGHNPKYPSGSGKDGDYQKQMTEFVGAETHHQELAHLPKELKVNPIRAVKETVLLYQNRELLPLLKHLTARVEPVAGEHAPMLRRDRTEYEPWYTEITREQWREIEPIARALGLPDPFEHTPTTHELPPAHEDQPGVNSHEALPDWAHDLADPLRERAAEAERLRGLARDLGIDLPDLSHESLRRAVDTLDYLNLRRGGVIEALADVARRYNAEDAAIPFSKQVSFSDKDPLGRFLKELIRADPDNPNGRVGLQDWRGVNNGSEGGRNWPDLHEIDPRLRDVDDGEDGPVLDPERRKLFEHALLRDQVRDERSTWAHMVEAALDELAGRPLDDLLVRLQDGVRGRGEAISDFASRVDDFVRADPGERIRYVDGEPPRLIVIDGQGNHDGLLARELAADRDLAERVNRGEVRVDYRGALVDRQGRVHIVELGEPEVGHVGREVGGRELRATVVRDGEGNWHLVRDPVAESPIAFDRAGSARPSHEIVSARDELARRLGIEDSRRLDPERIADTIADLRRENGLRAIQIEALVDYARSTDAIDLFHDLGGARDGLAHVLGIEPHELTPRALAEEIADRSNRNALRRQQLEHLVDYAKQLRGVDSAAADAAANRLAERLGTDREDLSPGKSRRNPRTGQPTLRMEPDLKKLDPDKLHRALTKLMKRDPAAAVDALAEYSRALGEIDPFTEGLRRDARSDPRVADGEVPMHDSGALDHLRRVVGDPRLFAEPRSGREIATVEEPRNTPEGKDKPVANSDWARVLGVDITDASVERAAKVYEVYRDGKIDKHERLTPEELSRVHAELREEVLRRAEDLDALAAVADEHQRAVEHEAAQAIRERLERLAEDRDAALDDRARARRELDRALDEIAREGIGRDGAGRNGRVGVGEEELRLRRDSDAPQARTLDETLEYLRSRTKSVELQEGWHRKVNELEDAARAFHEADTRAGRLDEQLTRAVRDDPELRPRTPQGRRAMVDVLSRDHAEARREVESARDALDLARDGLNRHREGVSDAELRPFRGPDEPTDPRHPDYVRTLEETIDHLFTRTRRLDEQDGWHAAVTELDRAAREFHAAEAEAARLGAAVERAVRWDAEPVDPVAPREPVGDPAATARRVEIAGLEAKRDRAFRARAEAARKLQDALAGLRRTGLRVDESELRPRRAAGEPSDFRAPDYVPTLDETIEHLRNRTGRVDELPLRQERIDALEQAARRYNRAHADAVRLQDSVTKAVVRHREFDNARDAEIARLRDERDEAFRARGQARDELDAARAGIAVHPAELGLPPHPDNPPPERIRPLSEVIEDLRARTMRVDAQQGWQDRVDALEQAARAFQDADVRAGRSDDAIEAAVREHLDRRHEDAAARRARDELIAGREAEVERLRAERDRVRGDRERARADLEDARRGIGVSDAELGLREDPRHSDRSLDRVIEDLRARTTRLDEQQGWQDRIDALEEAARRFHAADAAVRRLDSAVEMAERWHADLLEAEGETARGADAAEQIPRPRDGEDPDEGGGPAGAAPPQGPPTKPPTGSPGAAEPPEGRPGDHSTGDEGARSRSEGGRGQPAEDGRKRAADGSGDPVESGGRKRAAGDDPEDPGGQSKRVVAEGEDSDGAGGHGAPEPRDSSQARHDALLRQRAEKAAEHQFWRAKRNDRAERLELADTEGRPLRDEAELDRALGHDRLEATIMALRERIVGQRDIGAIGEDVPARGHEAVSSVEHQRRERNIFKLQDAAEKVNELHTELGELDRHIVALETAGAQRRIPEEVRAEFERLRAEREAAVEALKDKPKLLLRDELTGKRWIAELDRRIASLEAVVVQDHPLISQMVRAELDRLGGERAAEVLRIKPREAMLADLARRLRIDESRLGAEHLDEALREVAGRTVRAEEMAEHARRIRLLDEVARAVDQARNRIGRIQDRMAELAGAGKEIIESAGARRITERVGLIDGEHPRIIVVGPRDELGRPRGDHDDALVDAILRDSGVAQAMMRPETVIEYHRIIADRDGSWRGEQARGPQREYLRAGWNNGRRGLELVRWRDAEGRWHDVNPSRPEWTTGRYKQTVPKGFEPRVLPEGVSGWAVDPFQSAVTDPFVHGPPGAIDEELLPRIPGMDPVDPGVPTYEPPFAGVFYNTMRLILESAKLSGFTWYADSEHPGQVHPGFKKHPWFRAQRPDVQPMAREWDPRDHVGNREQLSGHFDERELQKERDWARVQRWADEEYTRFRADDSDIDAVHDHLAERRAAQRSAPPEESAAERTGRAEKLVDRVRERLVAAPDSAADRLARDTASELPSERRGSAREFVDEIRQELERDSDGDHGELVRRVAGVLAHGAEPSTEHVVRADRLVERIQERLVSRPDAEANRIAQELAPHLRDENDSSARALVDEVRDVLADRTDAGELAGRVADRLAAGDPVFTREQIEQIKNHLMRDRHLVRDPEDGVLLRRPLDAVADVAEAWNRLIAGEPLPEDVLLLQDALAESNYLRANPTATWRDANAHAIMEGYDWDAKRPKRTEWRADIPYRPARPQVTDILPPRLGGDVDALPPGAGPRPLPPGRSPVDPAGGQGKSEQVSGVDESGQPDVAPQEQPTETVRLPESVPSDRTLPGGPEALRGREVSAGEGESGSSGGRRVPPVDGVNEHSESPAPERISKESSEEGTVISERPIVPEEMDNRETSGRPVANSTVDEGKSRTSGRPLETPEQWNARFRAESADWDARMEAERAAWLRRLAEEDHGDSRIGNAWAAWMEVKQAEWNARMVAEHADWLWDLAGGRPTDHATWRNSAGQGERPVDEAGYHNSDPSVREDALDDADPSVRGTRHDDVLPQADPGDPQQSGAKHGRQLPQSGPDELSQDGMGLPRDGSDVRESGARNGEVDIHSRDPGDLRSGAREDAPSHDQKSGVRHEDDADSRDSGDGSSVRGDGWSGRNPFPGSRIPHIQHEFEVELPDYRPQGPFAPGPWTMPQPPEPPPHRPTPPQPPHRPATPQPPRGPVAPPRPPTPPRPPVPPTPPTEPQPPTPGPVPPTQPNPIPPLPNPPDTPLPPGGNWPPGVPPLRNPPDTPPPPSGNWPPGVPPLSNPPDIPMPPGGNWPPGVPPLRNPPDTPLPPGGNWPPGVPPLSNPPDIPIPPGEDWPPSWPPGVPSLPNLPDIPTPPDGNWPPGIPSTSNPPDIAVPPGGNWPPSVPPLPSPPDVPMPPVDSRPPGPPGISTFPSGAPDIPVPLNDSRPWSQPGTSGGSSPTVGWQQSGDAVEQGSTGQSSEGASGGGVNGVVPHPVSQTPDHARPIEADASNQVNGPGGAPMSGMPMGGTSGSAGAVRRGRQRFPRVGESSAGVGTILVRSQTGWGEYARFDPESGVLQAVSVGGEGLGGVYGELGGEQVVFYRGGGGLCLRVGGRVIALDAPGVEVRWQGDARVARFVVAVGGVAVCDLRYGARGMDADLGMLVRDVLADPDRRHRVFGR
ncbi:WXG100-like domain-containing protein [Nocardia pseudobrasiliensis]|uniref:Papain fold toxin 1 (Glutamine deamidase) of polymorphic toxin system n=1 Tax=Nocardia pseudobrasiliensis TaxID=45979 RepID=A0A370I1B8_9NOCA|nr:toxin glutamine deamidase domain-containing protein [Nocardia pseudobrasiliensis]RDI64527.1 papain fold toxin 1 (glutamine deamidase) of polymorphic toxin system [Nocardia pseudobrasiliensis]